MKLYCADCGNECDTKTVDYGHGRTEYWGAISVDRNLQIVSECCEGLLYENCELTKEAA